jgi:hypothetical protein
MKININMKLSEENRFSLVKFEVFTAVTMKNGVFWDVTLFVSCKNRRSMRRLLDTASVVPSSPILVTLMKEALSSSETSVLTRVTKRNIPEDTLQIFLYFTASRLALMPICRLALWILCAFLCRLKKFM